MKFRYITIEREYGSGGLEIAKKVSEKCGVRCYGREIMETVAKEQNISVADLEEYEESVSGSFLYSMFVMSQSQTGNPDLLSGEAKLFVAENRVIKRLSLNGPAIFVGHCASLALRETKGVVSVFIRASDEFERNRAVEKYGIPEKDVASVCKKANKKRANYYSFCTQEKWNDYDNYDIVLDSSALGTDGCAEVLSALLRK